MTVDRNAFSASVFSGWEMVGVGRPKVLGALVGLTMMWRHGLSWLKTFGQVIVSSHFFLSHGPWFILVGYI